MIIETQTVGYQTRLRFWQPVTPNECKLIGVAAYQYDGTSFTENLPEGYSREFYIELLPRQPKILRALISLAKAKGADCVTYCNCSGVSIERRRMTARILDNYGFVEHNPEDDGQLFLALVSPISGISVNSVNSVTSHL